MRTNIDIDDATLEAAMRAGPFTTKKDAVEAGLKLLARQAAYREILKWEGKLHWDGDDTLDAPAPASTGKTASASRRLGVNEPAAKYLPAKKPHGRR
ncbi:MAG TPA: type II toxin-antitoxin system VapB family antitoxin [Burkholderiaceae bacterium]|jgi:Arc/MetJ family transcription regulator